MEENKAQNGQTLGNNIDFKKYMKYIIPIAIIVVIVLAIVIYFKVFYRTSIDVTKYIEIEYSGFNGYATAEATVNTSEMEELFENERLYYNFLNYYNIEIENNENLSNGDTVVVNIKITNEDWLKENKLKLGKDSVSFEVEGLEEGTVVDVFADLEIEVSGYSPEISISVNNNNADDFIRTVTYSLSQSSDLSNGDVVTITAQYSEDTAFENKAIVAEDTMEYTIENQGYYVSSVDDLGEEALSTIKQELSDVIDVYINDYVTNGVSPVYDLSRSYGLTDLESADDAEVTEPELVNMYLLTPKENNHSSCYNYIYAIYKMTFTDTGNNSSVTWYFAGYVKEVAVLDGEIANYSDLSFERESNKNEDVDDLYTNCIDSMKTGYIIETIE